MIIETTYGKLRGEVEEDCISFKGIPYAAPPIGERRFMPPVPPECFDDVRDCTKYANAAPQLHVTEISVLQPGESLDEDCLYLNVFAPKSEGIKKAVLLFVHGGAFQKGSGMLNFSPKVFTDDDIIAVTVNYRLGALGFLDFSSYLGEEYAQSGNNGILDIVAALRWINENIASFGGDPENVTVMGQSAGAKIASTLTILRPARGLFSKIVSCSGGIQCTRDKLTAARITDMFMADAQLNKDNAHELLTMPWQDIVKAQSKIFAGLNLHTCGPVFDGINIVGDNALDIIRKGEGNPVPALIGTNRDELQLYYDAYKFHDLDETMAIKLFGDNADIVLRHCESLDRSAEDFPHKFVDMMTEYIYRNGSVQLVEVLSEAGCDVYLYRNDFDKAPQRAGHTSEDQFMMGFHHKYNIVKDEAYFALVEGVSSALHMFIKSGRAKADTLPEWQTYNPESRLMMRFDTPPEMVECPLPYVAKELPEQVFYLK